MVIPTYKELAMGLVSQAIEKSNNIAQSRPGSKRAVAAGTASVLLEMGMESYNKEDTPTLTSDQISSIESVGSSAEAEEKEKNKSKHFTDRLIDKLVQTSIPNTQRDLIEERIKDNKTGSTISIVQLTGNFKKLLVKLTLFFKIYHGIVHVLTWKRPSKTLSMLILYTGLVNYPHLILVYPLVYVLFGVFIPGYVHRHPMRRPELIKVNKRGQSMWNYFFDSEETSILDEYIEEREDLTTPESTEPSEEMSMVETIPDEETVEKRKSQIDVMLNLKDLQNLTSELLVGIEKGEQVYFDIGGFKDERFSTFLFYVTLISTWVVLFLGQFIPWRLLFIQIGWGGLLLCHPKSKSLFQKIPKKQNKPESSPAIQVKKDEVFDRMDIIVDDSPEIRQVEIFELQIKSILQNHWRFYRYSNTIFDKNNKSRISGKRPRGVDELSKVLPPQDWKFDFGLVNKWEIDRNPKKFLIERSYDMSLFKLKSDEWIYDNQVIDEESYEFRRRRLTRECYQYGK